MNMESVIGAQSMIARAADAIGAVPAPVRPSSMQDYLRKLSINAPKDINDGIGTVVGAGAGYYLWKKHKWLGAIGGASIGRNIPAVVHGVDRNIAFANMAQTGAGVAGSIFWKKYPKLGFVGGWLVGGLISGAMR
jgi:hypothetical protein